MTLSEIAARLGLAWEGADVAVTRPALVEDAGPGAICLAMAPEYAARALEASAAALVTPIGLASPLPCLRAQKPRVAFARLLALYDRRPQPEPGVHSTAIVSPTASVEATASIGPYAVVADGARIGARTTIGPCAFVGEGACLGDDCRLGPHTVVHYGCSIGSRVRLQAGAVIGSEGFGYEWDGERHVPVPHLGTVVLEDDVDVGANSTVDRAKTGETRIGRGTKIDNLVQIGHGVRVGAFALLVAQVGIGGSSRVGDGTVLAGQVGMADALEIGPGAVVAAQSGITGSLEGGKTYMGTPAREVGEARRVIAATGRLPGLFARVRALERAIRDLGGLAEGHNTKP